jgi:hypothetical protein
LKPGEPSLSGTNGRSWLDTGSRASKKDWPGIDSVNPASALCMSPSAIWSDFAVKPGGEGVDCAITVTKSGKTGPDPPVVKYAMA